LEYREDGLKILNEGRPTHDSQSPTGIIDFLRVFEVGYKFKSTTPTFCSNPASIDDDVFRLKEMRPILRNKTSVFEQLLEIDMRVVRTMYVFVTCSISDEKAVWSLNIRVPAFSQCSLHVAAIFKFANIVGSD